MMPIWYTRCAATRIKISDAVDDEAQLAWVNGSLGMPAGDVFT